MQLKIIFICLTLLNFPLKSLEKIVFDDFAKQTN